jgi:hypothetical protein
MNNESIDAPLIDAVMGYCAFHRVSVNSLGPLNFLEVSKRLAHMCQDHPKWVWASMEVRKYYPICHPDCHLKRIQALMQDGGRWQEGCGPNAQHYENNVVDFPTSTTKH